MPPGPTFAAPSTPVRAPHVVVVGGGVSGLAAAESLVRADPRVRVTVLDAADRLGGIVQTERVDGFVMEVGPDAVVAAKPATRALCERLGIADRLHGASVRGAYVYRAGRLRRLPAGLSGLMPTRLAPLATSRILSARGLLRVGAEPWRAAPSPAPEDESIERFVVRRLGREAYERLVEPLLTGIYAGDGARLSVAATFPQLRALEAEHGSLLRGLRARGAGPAPASPFLSLPTGLQELIEALERTLRATGRVELRLGAAVRAVRPLPGAPAFGALVELRDGTRLVGDAVVVAAPAPVAAALLQGADPALARELADIPHGSTATVTLAYDAGAVRRPLDATGYVVPRRERRDVLACTWASSKWAGRAPAGQALFRLFFGGAHRAHLLGESDDALLARARAELRGSVGVTTAPRLARVHRWTRAMPQYEVGHPARVARIAERTARHAWLALAGNAYTGVGVPDCIRSGEAAAARVLAGLRDTAEDAGRAA